MDRSAELVWRVPAQLPRCSGCCESGCPRAAFCRVHEPACKPTAGAEASRELRGRRGHLQPLRIAPSWKPAAALTNHRRAFQELSFHPLSFASPERRRLARRMLRALGAGGRSLAARPGAPAPARRPRLAPSGAHPPAGRPPACRAASFPRACSASASASAPASAPAPVLFISSIWPEHSSSAAGSPHPFLSPRWRLSLSTLAP